MSDGPLYVTRPSFPPLEDYVAYLRTIWDSSIVTNNGPLVQQLEEQLQRRLGVPNVVAVTNGTIALQLAIRAFELRGEIITTPFTWIASVNAIMWESCTPVFVDVRPDTFNIDPDAIEAAITGRTSAIMPVHVFGSPCDVERIEAIAARHGLRVIYDAAHAMFVEIDGRSLLTWGDISATSFHATKIFQTGEGGACVARSPDVARRLRRLRFFGHDERRIVVDEGLNGKMSDIHAALGLASLPWVDAILDDRRRKSELYFERLRDCRELTFQAFPKGSYNYTYMPVLFRDEARLLAAVERLNAAGIFPRRYFDPALNTVAAVAPYRPVPVAEDLARRIVCLPLYWTMTDDDVRRVCDTLREALAGRPS